VRTVSPAMQTLLRQDGMVLAVLAKVRRQDGVVLGMTTYDQDVAFDMGDGDGSVTYHASNAIVGSAIKQSVGAAIDNMDVVGVLNSDYVTDVDIMAGRYDNAQVTMSYVNPLDLTMGQVVLLSGVIGEVRMQDGQYTVEFRSWMQVAKQAVGELTNPSCRVVQLGDARCKFNLAGNTATGKPARSTGTVTSVESNYGAHFSGIVTDAGFYTYGQLLWLTGANAGLPMGVKSHGSFSTYVNKTFDTGLSGNGVPWSPTSTGLPFTFSVPAGTWVAGYVTVTLHTLQRANYVAGGDPVYMQMPDGSQYVIANVSASSLETFVVPLGSSSVTAFNTLAGMTMSAGFSRGNVTGSSPGYTRCYVQSCTVTLTGTPATTSDLLVFEQPMPFPVSAGDTATVTVGCDRLISTCSTKFGNTVNFRGEPYVPGLDQVIAVGRQ
jgi:uncharacterized phage protein (TIGR02218 family)